MYYIGTSSYDVLSLGKPKMTMYRGVGLHSRATGTKSGRRSCVVKFSRFYDSEKKHIMLFFFCFEIGSIRCMRKQADGSS